MERQLAKEIRLLGMTRDDVVKKLKITNVTLSNWITGKHTINPVGVRMLQEIGVPREAIREPSKKV